MEKKRVFVKGEKEREHRRTVKNFLNNKSNAEDIWLLLNMNLVIQLSKNEFPGTL